jgi:hypothetical protein
VAALGCDGRFPISTTRDVASDVLFANDDVKVSQTRWLHIPVTEGRPFVGREPSDLKIDNPCLFPSIRILYATRLLSIGTGIVFLLA